MSQLANSPTSRMESILACTHCARAKAKCDRKMPCTRCVDKGITCQTRSPRRGQGQPLNHKHNVSKSNRAPSRRVDLGAHSEAAEAIAANGSATDQHAQSSQDPQQASEGSYIDWSLVGQNPSVFLPNDLIEYIPNAENHELLWDAKMGRDFKISELQGASIATISEGGTPCPSGLRQSTFMLSHPSPIGDHYDFGVLPDVTDISPCGMTFGVPVETPIQTTCERALLIKDDAADVQVQALEAWPIFKCNPAISSYDCTPTASRYVNNLRTLLVDCTIPLPKSRPIDSSAAFAPILATTRERLIAVLQGFFNDTQQVYGFRGMTNGTSDPSSPLGLGGPSIVFLPPPPVLESLFHAYFGSCEPYYPFITMASRNLNERMHSRRMVLPSIFVLLMLASGALIPGADEIYQQTAHGLIEICRIALRKQVEQDIQIASDPDFLECALLLTVVAVWGGDKWQMDIAICQKAMFLEMHSQADCQDGREAQVARLKSTEDVSECWQVWEEQERANRITYSWLILDHEICLFQDIPSMSFLSITTLNAPIPNPDASWGIQSAKHWMQGMSQSPGGHGATTPPSLDEYVRCFRETDDLSILTHISPTSLRLLLCYLQNLVIQLRCSTDGIPSKSEHHRTLRHASLVLLSVQFQEAQELLRKWYKLATTHCMSRRGSPTPSLADASSAGANMMIYHLVMLNTMVSFPEVERLARSEPVSQMARPAHWKRTYHLENMRQIHFHCGQILRLIRSMPESGRPSWWAGAVYRVALIAWANAMSNRIDPDTSSSSTGCTHYQGGTAVEEQDTLILDTLPADHPSIEAYLNQQGAIPVFCDLDGSMVSLHNAVDILYYCSRVIDSGLKTKFCLGIQQKLYKMAQRWEGKATGRATF